MLLTENRSVGAQKAPLSILPTDVEHLTPGRNVSVITRQSLIGTFKATLWWFVKDWVVNPWLSRNSGVIAIFIMVIMLLLLPVRMLS